MLDNLHFSLLQALMDNVEITDGMLQSEAQRILKMADGISKCVIEYVKSKHYAKGNFQAVVASVVVGRSLQAVLWENSPFVGKQLAGMDAQLATVLCDRGKKTLQSIMQSTATELEDVSEMSFELCLAVPE